MVAPPRTSSLWALFVSIALKCFLVFQPSFNVGGTTMFQEFFFLTVLTVYHCTLKIPLVPTNARPETRRARGPMPSSVMAKCASGAPFPSLPARQTRQRSKQEIQQSMSLTTDSGQQPVSLAISTRHPLSCCSRQVSSQQRAVRSFTMWSLLYNTQHVTTRVASKCVWGIRSTFRDSSTAATGRVYSSTCISTALPRCAGLGRHLVPGREEDEEEEEKVALAPDVGRALVSAEKLTQAGNEVHLSRSRPHIKHASSQVTPLRRGGGVFVMNMWFRRTQPHLSDGEPW